MSHFLSRLKNLTALVFVGLLLTAIIPLYSGAAVAIPNIPAAGECAEGAEGLVCNVQGQTLSFKTVSGVTQTGTGTNSFNPGVGQSITYSSVFSDGTYTVDAVLRVDAKTNITNVDRDLNTLIADAINVQASSSSSTEMTITFQDSISKAAVTLLNVTIIVQDIDGTQVNPDTSVYVAKEFATFQGLDAYTATTQSDLRVSTNASQPAYNGNGTLPGSEATNPETGLRQFYSEQTADSSVDEKNAVAVTFNSTTSVGILTGAWGSGGGINFLFAPVTIFTLPTTTQTINSGTYTVDYNADGGSGTLPSSQTASGAITLSTGMGLTSSSIPISGWSTLPSGGGAKYALGASFTPVKNTTLYAVYQASTVTFNANTGTGSNTTQVSSGPTALNANPFTKNGYRFTNWATNADGTGATYDNLASFPFLVNDTLYAQWAQEFMLSFDANGGSGSMANQTEIAATAISSNSFARSGFRFTGWNTQANGNGTAYIDGASFPFTASGTLYAQWVQEFVLSFDANGGSGSMADQTEIAAAAISSNSFARSGFRFTGWNTQVNGSGTAYSDGASFPFTASGTLYAQWLQEFVLSFDANGGSGSMADQTEIAAAAISSNSFARSGFRFTGWNTQVNGSGTAYSDGASFPFTASATLYAQWEPVVSTASSQSGSLSITGLSNLPILTGGAAVLILFGGVMTTATVRARRKNG